MVKLFSSLERVFFFYFTTLHTLIRLPELIITDLIDGFITTSALFLFQVYTPPTKRKRLLQRKKKMSKLEQHETNNKV